MRSPARATLAEFAVIGALAGLIAAAGANALGYVLAQRVMNIGYGFSFTVWAVGVVCSIVGIVIAGHLGNAETRCRCHRCAYCGQLA